MGKRRHRLSEGRHRRRARGFVVPGIRHLGVSDLPELAGAPSLRAAVGRDAAIATFTATQNALAGGFLDQHVGGVASDFPASALAAHPEVIVQDLGWLRERARARAEGLSGSHSMAPMSLPG